MRSWGRDNSMKWISRVSEQVERETWTLGFMHFADGFSSIESVAI